jgi:hypothetical protein
MDWNIIIALLVVVALCAFFIFMKKRNFKYYNVIKLALLIVGMSFKDVKIKGIADIAMIIVKELEKLDMASTDKQKEAIKAAAVEIFARFNITLDDDVLARIVDIAVAYMPENQ